MSKTYCDNILSFRDLLENEQSQQLQQADEEEKIYTVGQSLYD